MTNPGMCKRSFLLQGLIGSILINFLMFCSIPSLVDFDTSSNDIENIQTVFLSRIKQDPFTPKPKEKPKPKEEKLEKIFKITQPNKRIPKQKLQLDLPDMDLNIDPRLADGVPVMASPPPVKSNVDFDDILDANKLDIVPAPSFKRHPRYPYRAKRMGIEGSVKIRFLVDKEGRVSNISIVKAVPPDLFEQSVIDAVSTWKYSPGELMGRKVSAWVTTTIIFKLEN